MKVEGCNARETALMSQTPLRVEGLGSRLRIEGCNWATAVIASNLDICIVCLI